MNKDMRAWVLMDQQSGVTSWVGQVWEQLRHASQTEVWEQLRHAFALPDSHHLPHPPLTALLPSSASALVWT